MLSSKKRSKSTSFFNNYRNRYIISYIFDFLFPIEYFRISMNKILFKILKERSDFPKNSLQKLKKNKSKIFSLLNDIYSYFQSFDKISIKKERNYIINFILKNNLRNSITFDEITSLRNDSPEVKKLFVLDLMKYIQFHTKINVIHIMNFSIDIKINLIEHCLCNIEELYLEEGISKNFLKLIFEKLLIPDKLKKLSIYSGINKENINLYENFLSKTKLMNCIIFGTNILSQKLLKVISQSLSFGSSLKMIHCDFNNSNNEEIENFIENLDKRGVINVNITKPKNSQFDFISKFYQIYSKEESLINNIICQNENFTTIPIKLNYEFGNIALGFNHKNLTIILGNNIEYYIKNGKYFLNTGNYTLENDFFKQFYYEYVIFYLDTIKNNTSEISLPILFQFLLFEDKNDLKYMIIYATYLKLITYNLDNCVKFNYIKEIKLCIRSLFFSNNDFILIKEIIRITPYVEKLIFENCYFYDKKNNFISIMIGDKISTHKEIAKSKLKEIYFNDCYLNMIPILKTQTDKIEEKINKQKKGKKNLISIKQSNYI